MAIKDIIAFPYVPTEDQLQPLANRSAIDLTPFMIYNFISDANGLNVAAYEDAAGRWLKVRPKFAAGTTTVAKMSSIIWPYSALYGVTVAGVYYFGYRWKFNPQTCRRGLASMPWLTKILSIVISTTNTAMYLTDLLLPADIGFVEALNTESAEYYIEGRLDFPNAKATIWVDGVKIKDVTIAQPATAAGANGSLSFGDYSAGAGVPYNSSYYDNFVKDLYWKEVSNANDDFRLGPQVIDPLPVASVTAPGWTPQGAAALLDVLATPVTTVASRSTPYAKNDPGRTPAEIKYGVNHNTTKINAAAFQVSAMRDNGSPGVSYAKFSDGTNATADSSSQLGITITAGTKVVMEKSPAGNRLAESDITGGKLIITPAAT